VTALAQNGDGLRADQAGAADLHGLTPLLMIATFNHHRAPANFRNDPPNREQI
jgi:hypothetical protein